MAIPLWRLLPFEIFCVVLSYIHPCDHRSLSSVALTCRQGAATVRSEVIGQNMFQHAVQIIKRNFVDVHHCSLAVRRKPRSEASARSECCGGYPLDVVVSLDRTWQWKWRHAALWMSLSCCLCSRKAQTGTGTRFAATEALAPDSIICPNCARAFVRFPSRSGERTSSVVLVCQRRRILKCTLCCGYNPPLRDPLQILSRNLSTS